VKFTDKVREAVVERAGNRCERCGLPVNGKAQYHHRRPRGMGGSKDPVVGTAANCLFLHPACHTFIESYRQKALRSGYLVTQYQDPEEIPVKRWDGWVLLGQDGSLQPVDAPLPLDQIGEVEGDGEVVRSHSHIYSQGDGAFEDLSQPQ
jgi:5-methylcytosine-specific restriction protein A